MPLDALEMPPKVIAETLTAAVEPQNNETNVHTGDVSMRSLAGVT